MFDLCTNEMPTGGKIKFKLKKLQLPDENDEASRQTRANKTVIFRQKFLGDAKFLKLDTGGHFQSVYLSEIVPSPRADGR